jgi:lipoprotein-anchoring transpeptidase ErfK/SrfK
MSSSLRHINGIVGWLAIAVAASGPLLVARAAVGEGAEAALRRSIAWQVALDARGISPGLIDGRIGPKTRLATREFQRTHRLPITGELDDATAQAIGVAPDEVLGRYTIQPADLAEIGPAPRGWLAKSKLRRLGHESLETVLAEKFHCARHLLRTLNPGTDLTRLKAGDKVVVPIVQEPTSLPRAAYVEIDVTEKVIRVVDEKKQLAGLFHCSVARSKSKLPRGETRVISVVPDPTYTFDPKMWPEVKERIDRPLTIPPGPRNPVGRCWIGLGLPGYGMHGTPNPELIGKTGSHGCIRLANWDAVRLSKMVEIGTPVRFVGHAGAGVASTR